MNLEDLRFTKSHEWAKLEDGKVRVGISDYAQKELGDIVFVELPTVGTQLKQGDQFGTVESTKSASELFSPVTGKVVEVNQRLNSEPQLINQSPYEQGWMIVVEVEDKEQLKGLLSLSEYETLIHSEEA